MLYLKAMSVDRFKSFKHVSLLFNKGFNCIVGPNGSGKSNIVDALLFSLGESSLHRLRVRRLDELIHTAASKRASSLSKAHVKIEFAGDEKIEITRGVRTDGKTVYRLNGKRMTRQEVLEVLKKYRVRIDETSTITQGEINRLMDLNPKQRRELIDLAAGIKEFEHKKAEALLELEKVSSKIAESQAVLNERMNFLKGLEKEKEAAERHLAMTQKLKTLNYNVLSRKRKTIQASLDSYAIELVNLGERKKKMEARLAEVAKKIADFDAERQKLTKIMSESSNVLGEIGTRQKEIEKESSAIDFRITANNVAVSDAKKAIERANEEVGQRREKVTANEAAIDSLKGEIEELEKRAKDVSKAGPGAGADLGERAKEIGALVDALEEELTGERSDLSGARSKMASLSSQMEIANQEISRLNEQMESGSKSVREAEERIASLASRKARFEKDLSRLQTQLEETKKDLARVSGEVLSLKEQKAVSGSREGALQERLRNAFGEEDGFYGTAAELCSYGSEHAEAIEAAAGARFNYFVVDSIDSANKVIQYLKKQNIGRATFIPLQEINVGEEKAERGLRAVVDLLSFDSKFKDAFAYIFSDTYLVDSVDDAKRLGIGKHRYVTVSGETVERSGVLSGGARSRGVPVVALNKKLKQSEKEQKELSDLSTELGNKIFDCRKDIASLEFEISSANSAASDSGSRSNEAKQQLPSRKKEMQIKEGETARLGAQITELEKKVGKGEKELADKKEELRKTYDEMMRLTDSKITKEDKEELDMLRKEVETLKIENAKMQQESKMLSQSVEELSRAAKEKEALVEKTQKEIDADMKRRTELEEAKAKIEQEIKNSGKSNKKAYERLEEINSDVLELGQERGTASAGAENLSKQMEEIRVRKGQQEVRLNDITAELAAYGNVEIEEINQEVESMEKEANLISSKISELGSVNLKAPEVYEEKVRSVSEATEKVNTLEAEKMAVLSMIEEINSKKLNAFITTYNEINKNFSKLYSYIFPGNARIELEDANNPLSGGLDIKIEDGKGFKRLNSLSGGQKSLISLVLVFSIHMCKPSSVYLFDEIDSALDKENSKKLSQLIREMGKEAQFIVVSHNDSLIVNADAALGVVKTDEESKIVGIEISSITNK